MRAMTILMVDDIKDDEDDDVYKANNITYRDFDDKYNVHDSKLNDNDVRILITILIKIVKDC